MTKDTKPQAHFTNPGKNAQKSEWTGSDKVIGTDTDILSPKDDTPWKLKEKEGPVSGTVKSDTSSSKKPHGG